MTQENNAALESRVLEAIKRVFDPDIPVNIYDLGLIYDIKIEEDNTAYITMTLTSPNCPVAESLPVEVEDKVNAVRGIKKTQVTVTFDPPWDKDMISDEAKLELGLL
ncbi:MAG: DUF59 domain-containing protein [Bacteroidales bacterium]